MGWDQMTNAAASGLLFVCSTIFVVTYHLHARWRSTQVGRHMMAVAATLAVLGLYTVLITICPHGHGATALRVIRTLVLVAIAALMLQRTRMVIRVQRQHKTEETPHV